MQKFPYLATLFFSVVALVLLVVNLSLTVSNRGKQSSLSEHQTTLAQSQPIVQLDQALIRMVAMAAIKGDSQMRALLASEGISLEPPKGAAPAAPVEKK